MWEGIEEVCLNCTDPLVMPIVTSAYSVEIFDENGCSALDDINVIVEKERNIYIPNAFSPNEDGNNDEFMIFSILGVKEINSFQIYSRWGELVFSDSNFQPNDPTNSWDGTFNGEVLNPAVFVYFAQIEFLDGKVILYKGDVTLLR